MTTTNPNTNTNQPGLLDRATSFFKGTSKKPTNTLTSSLEHLHTSQHAQADAEAQHQADLMSGLPSGMPEGTQSLSSETIPQPMPRQVLNDVLSAHGHVPHAHHVDVDKVEQRHEQAVGPLGQVQQESLLDKAKHAIDSLTGKSTSTQHPIQHHPNIPHSVLPEATLKQVQTAQGHPPHARHVDVGQVEQRHEQSLPLGHVQPEPSVLEKVTNKLQDLVPPATFSSTSSTVQTHPNIPHAAVPDQVLLDVQSQKGKVPHAQHVDVGKVEQRHDQAVGPLGTVQKEPGILDRVANKISELVPSLAPVTTTSSNVTIHKHPNIPHAAVPNSVLRDIQGQHGRVPHARHVDIKAVERQHEQTLGLGRVQDVTLLHKAKHAIDSMTGKTVAPLQHRPIQRHHNIPHSVLPDATLHQIHASHGHPPHAKHVDIGWVEQRQEQRMIQAVGPLGRVLPGPTLLEKANLKIQQLAQPLATSLTAATAPRPSQTIDQHPNIPHAAVPDQVLRDVQSQRGKVPHAHHVDINQVEKQHEQAVGPLGHVQQEPTILNKMGDKLQDMLNRPTTTAAPMVDTHPTIRPAAVRDQDMMNRPTTTTAAAPMVDTHPTIRHAAVPDQVLKDVESQKGKVPHAHHVDLGPVERRHEQAVGPLGHVQKEPTLMDKAKNAVGLGDTTTMKPTTTTTQLDQHPNIPHAAVPDQVLKDVQHQKGKVPHAHHVDVAPIEQRHEQAVGPLGHVQKEPTFMDKAKNAVGLGDKTTRPTTKTTNTVPTDQHPNIPHAAVPDQVLKDVEHQKGKVPHAHHVDVGKVEQRHEQAVGPLGHVQKEPTLMDKAKHALGMEKDKPTTTTTNKDQIPTTTAPTHDLHLKNVPDAKFINTTPITTTQPQSTAHPATLPTTSSLPAGTASSLPLPTTAASLPGTTTLPLNDQGVMPIAPQQTTTTPNVVPVEPTLLDKMEYKLFGVVPTKAAPATTTTAATDTGKKPTTTTTTDQHSNIPHAAVPDQVLKDVQHQKGKVPHAHHVDVGKVEQRHDEAVGPLGHVQKEPTFMDKAKHALGMDKDKTTTTNKDLHKDQAPIVESRPMHMDDKTQPNIMHNSLPTRVMNELKDQHGHVPHAKHVDINQVEGQRERRLSHDGMIGRVVDPSKRPDVMHSSLPAGTLSEIESREGQIPNARHVDTKNIERERERNLAQNKDIGRVMEPSSNQGPNIMHNSLPTRVMQDVKQAHGQVPHAHHVDINQVEKDRERRLSDSHMMGRVPPSGASSTHERSNSGYTAGGFGFPESNLNTTSSGPAAYFKNTGTGSLNLPSSNQPSSNQPASSLTSDLGYKSGLTGTSTSKSTTSPLVATLPAGSNLESASGVKFQPENQTSTGTTSNIKTPVFHEQK